MRVELIGLGYQYPQADTWLLRGISQELHEGSMTAYVGPSGSGKSTLLNIIGGLIGPTEGAVAYSDATGGLGGTTLERTQMAWVLQTNTVLAGRSALDNVALGLVAHGFEMEAARDEAAKALAAIGLAQRVFAPVSELSGGEVQRVTIARCLAAPASLILADEPTGQLDHANTTSVVDALELAASVGKTVIIATHDEYVARRCHSVFELIAGTVAERAATMDARSPL
jgi:ABC-type lipoprotein export system ATPase subunit